MQIIADVTGHGFGPALFAAETSAYLRALAETVGDGVFQTGLDALMKRYGQR